MAENMESIWQQAELNTGLAVDLARKVAILRDRMMGGGPEDSIPKALDRPGILAPLDATARSLREAIDSVAFVIERLGEQGQVPQTANAIGERDSYRTGSPTRGY